jgi:putative glycosyltransferase (TIGR04372 family)
MSRRQLAARLSARLERARHEGIGRTVVQLLALGASAAVWLSLLPLTLLLHLAGFRRLDVLVGRIGHLAAEPDSFLKARALGQVPPARYFLLAPHGAVANETLLAYWQPFIPVVRGRALAWLLLAMSRWLLMKHDMSQYVLKVGASQKIYRINASWAGRPALLALSEQDRRWGDDRLAELGLPPGAWFVCVHVREPGFSPSDEAAHSHRNADPRRVHAAMQEIVRRGGWCMRMGDPSMTPLEAIPGVIDYAHHSLRSGRLDVMLCARARFFLGNTSGLALVSSAFGVPSALANMIPLSVLGVLPADLSIPKLLRAADGRTLGFAEVLDSPAGDFRYAHLYAGEGLRAEENSPEEILEMVREMLDRLDGSHADAPEDADLQARFMALLRPGHYSYGSASRVGAGFLRRHRSLLPPA